MLRILVFILAIMAAFSAPLTQAQGWQQRDDCPEGRVVRGDTLREPEDILALRPVGSTEPLTIERGDFTLRNFRGLDLTNVCFAGSVLIGTGWSGVTGDNMRFASADLSHSIWVGFSGATPEFYRTKLDKATLSGVNFPSVEFEYTSLSESNFSGADLSGGRFLGIWYASLRKTRFDGANMAGFRFECGIGQEDMCGHDSSGTSFRETNLEQAIFGTAHVSDWDFTDAIINRTRINLWHVNSLVEAHFAGPALLQHGPRFTAQVFAEGREPPDEATAEISRADLEAIIAARDQLQEPGFDCSEAKGGVEKYICSQRDDTTGPTHLANVDRELKEVFALARARSAGLRETQRAWLAERDTCLDEAEYWQRDACLARHYRERIDALWAIVGQEHDMKPGERRIYATDIDFISQIGDPDLLARLAIPLLWNSGTVVMVERDLRGRLFAHGETVGGNYHVGILTSPMTGMQFDPASGFYGGKGRLCSEELSLCPIVQFRGKYLIPGDERPGKQGFNDYIVTGARASFDRMVRVPLTQEQIDRLFPERRHP